MPESENTINTEDVVDDSKSAEPTIVINNQEVPISKAEQTLKEMEHNLKSGYDKNYQKQLADVQAKAQEDVEKMQTALQEDIAFYRTHPNPEEWDAYEPKVYGGRGFTGNPSANKSTVSTNNNANNPVFNEAAKIPVLEQQLKELRDQLSGITTNAQESERIAAINTLNTMKKKYRYADPEMIKHSMERDFIQTGKHPTAAAIEDYFKKSDAHVRRYMNAGTSTTSSSAGTPSLPKVRDNNPAPSKNKVYPLDSEDLITIVAEKL
jgi:hypothetical protein